jgi:hypothetical protein
VGGKSVGVPHDLRLAAASRFEERHSSYNSLTSDSIEQVADRHAQYLAKIFGNPSDELKAFVDRLNNTPEAARAEAVIFAWLHRIGKNPRINENAGTGGMDFKCQCPIGGEFLVEVTSFGIEAVCSASGLSTDVTYLAGGAYKMITPELKLRVGHKMEQLSTGGQVPRILAIASEHPKIVLAFGRAAAVNLFVSDWAFGVPLSEPSAVFHFTDLKNSVFFQRDELNPAKLVSRRRSASAVLLVCICPDRVRAVGVVHPDPAIPLDMKVLPEVPLLYLPSWPKTDGRLKPEWTLPTDPPFPEHKRVRT